MSLGCVTSKMNAVTPTPTTLASASTTTASSQRPAANSHNPRNLNGTSTSTGTTNTTSVAAGGSASMRTAIAALSRRSGIRVIVQATSGASLRHSQASKRKTRAMRISNGRSRRCMINSHIDRALGDRQGCLAHRFRQRRMGMAGARDVLRRGAELHGYGSLGDHVAGVGAEDVDAEHAIARRIGKDFDEAFGLQVDLGTAVGGERKFADVVNDAGLLELLLAFPDRCDFGIGVHHVRDHVVIHVSGLAGENLRHRHAFVL